MTERLSVDVARDMLDRATDAVDQGAYESTSAVIDDALRLWAARRDHQIAGVRDKLAQGFASPARPWRGADAETEAWRERSTGRRSE